MTSYLILLLIAACCNIKADDWRMIALTALVGFGVSVPIPDQFFYAWCIFVELIVTVGAIALKTPATQPVFALSLCLSALHYVGFKLNGYPPESPYHILVKIAEHAELIACIVYSKLFLGCQKHAAK